MVTLSQLKPLARFTDEERAKASSLSPAIQRYLTLLDQPVSEFADELRHQRHEAWLCCALNTIFDGASTESICHWWSQKADEFVSKAWAEAGLDSESLALFALGKLGAQELNLSSDIDIIVMGSSPITENAEIKLRNFQKYLTEIRPSGFVFRVDFDLRPGGRSAPLIVTVEQFTNYYWSHGEPWERLALTRFRFVCGRASIDHEVEPFVKKFCFRKYIDISLLDELKKLRNKIHLDLLRKARDQYHLKLGVGAIRDIELFLQSLMVIHGGRIQALQQRQTPAIAAALKTYKLIEPNEANLLVSTYWWLRDLENRVQLIQDNQAHQLPSTQNFSRLLPKDCHNDFHQKTTVVDGIVTQLLGRSVAKDEGLPTELDSQKHWLKRLGFSQHSIEETWPQLFSLSSKAVTGRGSAEILQHFLHAFIMELSKSRQDLDLGLVYLMEFVLSTKAKSSFFFLLLRERRLLQDLALVFSLSPSLSSTLCSRPELVDSLLLHTQEPFSQDFDEMLDEMAERKLMSELISAISFLRSRNLVPLIENLTASADQICDSLLQRLKTDLAPHSTIEVLALGKWGGKEMGFRSDLDFIFVSSERPQPADLKIAQRFISRLQDPHRGGNLYGIDLRLRPSGSAGPLVVTKQSLNDFLLEEAAAWQRQSYIRARGLHSQDLLDVGFIKKGLSPDDLIQLRQIREKLTLPLTTTNEMNIKLSLGGLIDVELCIQTLLLSKQIVPVSTRTLDQMEQLENLVSDQNAIKVLKKNYLFLRQLEQIIKLVHQSQTLKWPENPQIQRKIAHLLDIEPDAITTSLFDILRETSEQIKNLDPIWSHS